MTSSVSKFYAGKSLFLTGGSGFIGKQIIEKLLRSCAGIEQINLLLRTKKDVSANDRLLQILKSPVFDRLKQERPDFLRKLVVVPGDTHLPRLGINDKDHARITSDVAVIIHSAASLQFMEPLRNAMKSNVISTRSALTLAKQTKNIEAFVHVSTAYSQIDKDNIDEQIYDSPIETSKIFAILDLLNDEQLALLTPGLIGKRPNVYTLTKSIAEKLVQEQKEHVPVAIVRPSIVTASYQEPFPGWADNISAASGIFVGNGLGMLLGLHKRDEALLDFIPVDLTANFILAAAWHTAKNKDSTPLTVYNFTSGKINPVTNKKLHELMNAAVRKSPSTYRIGKPGIYTAKYKFQRNFDVFVRLPLRAKLADTVLTLRGQKPKAMTTLLKFRKLQFVLEYFMSNDWRWESDNVDALYQLMSPVDKKEFNFDLASFNWDTYMFPYWLGLRKYFLKEPKAWLEPVPEIKQEARAEQQLPITTSITSFRPAKHR